MDISKSTFTNVSVPENEVYLYIKIGLVLVAIALFVLKVARSIVCKGYFLRHPFEFNVLSTTIRMLDYIYSKTGRRFCCIRKISNYLFFFKMKVMYAEEKIAIFCALLLWIWHFQQCLDNISYGFQILKTF